MSKELKKVDINGVPYDISGKLRYFSLSDGVLFEHDNITYKSDIGNFGFPALNKERKVITAPHEIAENLFHSVNRVFYYTIDSTWRCTDVLVDYNASVSNAPVKLYNFSDNAITLSALHCISDDE